MACNRSQVPGRCLPFPRIDIAQTGLFAYTLTMQSILHYIDAIFRMRKQCMDSSGGEADIQLFHQPLVALETFHGLASEAGCNL